MELLLDNHALLWTLYTPTLLPSGLADILREPTTHLSVSEGSVWELSDKAAKGRLPLAGNSVSQFMATHRGVGRDTAAH